MLSRIKYKEKQILFQKIIFAHDINLLNIRVNSKEHFVLKKSLMHGFVHVCEMYVVSLRYRPLRGCYE